MSQPAASALPAVFFLPASQGQRFCIYHPPAPGQPCRGALVYVAPFAEEMNRARRMAALQARAFAAAGIGVLLPDLYGCGDSSGDLGDATWDIWISDICLARDWLQQRLQRPAGLWGLRLGATLALDVARHSVEPPPTLLLWNPVFDGGSFLTQFLRLRLASDMLAPPPGGRTTVASLRARLAAGEQLEIAGYPLGPALAHAIDNLDITRLAPRAGHTHWIELLREGMVLREASAQWAQTWQQPVQTLTGPTFWSSPEISISQPLIERSCALLTQAMP